MSTSPTTPVPTASVSDTISAVSQVLLPVFGKGVIVRRPPMVRMAQKLELDRRAVRRMQQLAHTYGPGPLLLRVPLRKVGLVLEPEDVKRVLSGSPEPFAPATREKRAALSHFQPHGVLASRGAERADRRRFNEQVLGSDLAVHPRAGALLDKVVAEAEVLIDRVRETGELVWDDYAAAWMRAVRRVVLGDAARDDHAVTDLLGELRASANWAFLKPKSRQTRERFLRQLRGHLDRAEPDCLAGVTASTPTTEVTEPEQQVPQWLFAYDAAAWAGYRALALIAAHREHADRCLDELASVDLHEPHQSTGLRASVLESLRLYPTTPHILRETTIETTWATGTLPAGTTLSIFAPYFHRDDRHLPYADRFAPDVWEGRTGGRELGDLTDGWPLLPFSGGPAVCPGRNLVLLTTSAFLGVLLSRLDPRLAPEHPLHAGPPLPGTLDMFTLRFRPRR
ncbi:MAG: cytochrome P450 [Actinobacteria bacterium]|jgi:cytochrome P450|nr:cytochrome P450 [Actinomycetota bacterium]